MSDFGFFRTHRPWEDWCGMLLGLLIALSPWFPTGREAADAGQSLVILNTVVIGIIVFGLAQLEYVSLHRWEEVAAVVAGLWLMLSPFLFGYHLDGMLWFLHCCLGALVVLLSLLQLWQDRKLSDPDMLKDGR